MTRILLLAVVLSGCSADRREAAQQCQIWWDASKDWTEMDGVTQDFFMSRCTDKLEPLVPQCKGIATSVPAFCLDAANEIAYEITQEAKGQACARGS